MAEKGSVPVLMTWRQWLRLCKSKGYKLDVLEDEISRKGFSRPSISKLGRSSEPADPALVELAWKLKLLGPEDEFEMCWRWLASQGVEVPPDLRAKLAIPPPPKIDPEEIARGLVPKLETLLSDIRRQLDAVFSGIAGKLDAAAASLRGKFDGVEMKLKTVETSIEHADAKLEVMVMQLEHADAQRAKDKREIIRTVWVSMGLAALVTGILVHGRDVLTATPPPASTPQITVNLRTGQGLNEGTAQARTEEWFSVFYPGGFQANMGERVKSRMMPHRPLPGQASKPCPGSTSTLHDACWYETSQKAPCPPDQFQEGQKCYVPVQADPNAPVGQVTRPPEPE